MKIVLYNHKINWPAPKEPSWSSKVERWYQLDAAAYSIAETYSILQNNISKTPSFLILASPLGSMETDFQFVRGGAFSPSKFVHTLPNIRGASLLQVMDWQGPIICFQNDPSTWLTALREAIDLCSKVNQEIWVVQFRKNTVEAVYEVAWAQVLYDSLFELNSTSISQAFLIVSHQLGENNKNDTEQKDNAFWEWLSEPNFSSTFMISEGWNLLKIEK